MIDLSELRSLKRTRDEIRQFLRSDTPAEWFINKSLNSGSFVDKAFAIFYLYPCVSLGLVPSLDRKASEEAKVALKHKLACQVNEITESESETDGNVNTDITKFPNSYSSAVLVAGYLRTVESCGTAQESVNRALSWLTGKIVKPEGFVPSLYVTSNPKPSSYLTFWCAAALCEWQRHLRRENIEDDAVTESLRLLKTWSGRRLKDMLAFHYGGLRSQFDIIETAYALSTLLMTSESSDDRILVQHALSVLFDSYFDYGCLEASAPVFTDSSHMSVQLSTSEVLATVFIADPSHSVMAPHIKHIQATYEWLKDHGDPVKGWYPEGQGRANIANPYATASATLVLAEYSRLIEDRLDHDARRNLGIGPFVLEAKLSDVTFPGDLGPLLEETIFEPIRKGQRKIASYSMVLYGPPGTSKTTIAKLISQKLTWPLLPLDAGRFTEKGREGIDQAAAELFENLRYLKRVVVLFDEVEEFVQERQGERTNMESRLLTTAMLPRLQDLRDRQEIVFILATNHVKNIDTAITRLGRFDIVRCVLPPEQPERKNILDILVHEYQLPDKVQKFISERNIAEESDRFLLW